MLKTHYTLGCTGDALYRELLELYEGLPLDEAHALSARLILILMNEVGNAETIRSAFQAAQNTSC